MSRHNVALGKWGEQLAETLLVKRGATILALDGSLLRCEHLRDVYPP